MTLDDDAIDRLVEQAKGGRRLGPSGLSCSTHYHLPVYRFIASRVHARRTRRT